MALVKADIKQELLDLYALAKSTEMTDDQFADKMADWMINTLGTADLSGTAVGAQLGGPGAPLSGTLT